MTENTEPMAVEYDLAEIIGEGVDSLTAKLPGMSDQQLAELGALEGAAPKPRKTLLEAIAAETAGRVAAGGDGDDGDGDGDEDGDGEFADEPDAAPDGLPDVLELGGFGFDAGPTALLVFSGEGDARIKALAPLVFTIDQFEPRPDLHGMLLRETIDLPADLGRAVTVHKAWLLTEAGEAIAWAPIGMMPVSFGTGTGAQLAAGSLIFRRDA